MSSFGAWMRQAQMDLGVNNRTLAQKMDVDEPAISRWRNTKRPDPETVRRILDALAPFNAVVQRQGCLAAGYTLDAVYGPQEARKLERERADAEETEKTAQRIARDLYSIRAPDQRQRALNIVDVVLANFREEESQLALAS